MYYVLLNSLPLGRYLERILALLQGISSQSVFFKTPVGISKYDIGSKVLIYLSFLLFLKELLL